MTLAERLKVHPNVYRHAWITQSIPHQMLFIISEHPQDNLEAMVAREGAIGEARAKVGKALLKPSLLPPFHEIPAKLRIQKDSLAYNHPYTL